MPPGRREAADAIIYRIVGAGYRCVSSHGTLPVAERDRDQTPIPGTTSR